MQHTKAAIGTLPPGVRCTSDLRGGSRKDNRKRGDKPSSRKSLCWRRCLADVLVVAKHLTCTKLVCHGIQLCTAAAVNLMVCIVTDSSDKDLKKALSLSDGSLGSTGGSPNSHNSLYITCYITMTHKKEACNALSQLMRRVHAELGLLK